LQHFAFAKSLCFRLKKCKCGTLGRSKCVTTCIHFLYLFHALTLLKSVFLLPSSIAMSSRDKKSQTPPRSSQVTQARNPPNKDEEHRESRPEAVRIFGVDLLEAKASQTRPPNPTTATQMRPDAPPFSTSKASRAHAVGAPGGANTAQPGPSSQLPSSSTLTRHGPRLPPRTRHPKNPPETAAFSRSKGSLYDRCKGLTDARTRFPPDRLPFLSSQSPGPSSELPTARGNTKREVRAAAEPISSQKLEMPDAVTVSSPGH
jgi:hypothetical protein